ncbi:type I restriction endonuclease [Ketogulonicigenium vulgare]|uniref:Putative restriction endonuclease or methylase n=1 Tax=Ketogulonicigenium vulgare (strain WSH-001) TaxID=759362 RepID=F9YA22_KETVW|nr:type I restriction enzyme HsdR N-terminal domain-containing protein [Ketogulonicigenium vulgare]AEM41433.1 putative restriction endonuclease or methylase [Ketogulonicigenium vulgare WSH-001]ALJ81567.1 restriction endonuclease [Ketogulonicigenium vulgare]ANW34256.1 restriction endonuclease [Ketogulonicigenium vulgare]
MSIDATLKVLTERVQQHANTMLTEEAVKTAVVLPFLQALGYDVFNPGEVIPEFTADAVGKKGEKVDYAIKLDGEIRILIECKPISTNLDKVHLAQLYRYFSVTSAKFAVLTNGRFFHFHSDLEEPNKLDTRPFFTFDITEPNSQVLGELKKFEKSGFDVDGILANAERLKYTSALKTEINKHMDAPSDEFVRVLAAPVHEGRFTAAVLDQYRGLVKSAFREIIRDSVQERLSSALATTDTAAEIAEEPVVPDAEIVTTQDEVEGFMIVKAIVSSVIKPGRVSMRDQKSYCGILADDNNRRPIARLHFNRSTKYLGLFDGEAEERVVVESLDDIYSHAERLRQTAIKYPTP